MPVKEIAEYYNITIDQFFNLDRPIQLQLIREYYEEQELARYII